MYARKVGDKTLTFQVSGMLWKSSLVMRDVETKSLWSHILGEAMAGELKGKTLEIIPSSMTDWKTWLSRHPDTSIILLKRTATSFTNKIYTDPKLYSLGYVHDGHARAWWFTKLKQHPVVNEVWRGQKLLVVYDAPSGTAMLYNRMLRNRELHFSRKDGQLIDNETGSHWDWATGIATEGPLKDSVLTPLSGIVSYSRAWMAFHPDTEYWEPNKKSAAER